MHPEYWEESQQHRYEDRTSSELRQIREEMSHMRTDLKETANRVLMLFVGVGILAFVIPIVAPFIRQLLGVQIP